MWSAVAAGMTPQAAGADTTQLQTIVVTAQRRAQPIQDVPESISAITGRGLQEEDLKSLSGYLTAVPGITYDQSQGPTGVYGRQTVGIRGVQRFDYATDNTAGFYIDDTPIDITNLNLFDLNRIEVLRGPQGTLYGAGSEGGTIKLITNQPLIGQFSGQAKIEGTSVSDGAVGGEGDLVVNLPLNNMAALRIVGGYQRDPGYIDNYSNSNVEVGANINGGTNQDLRASLLIQPTSKLKITPSFDFRKSYYAATPDFDVGAGLPSLATRQYAPTDTTARFSLEGLNIRYDLGWAEFVSQTSYYDFSSDNHSDLTLTFIGNLNTYNSLAVYYASLLGLTPPPSPVPFSPFSQDYNTHERSLSEEARLVSRIEGPLSYVAGVFYQNVERPFDSSIIVPGFNATYGPYLGVLAPKLTFPTSPAGDVYSITHSTRNERQIAGYGEVTYAATRALHLTGGVRVYSYTSNSTDSFTGFAFEGVPALAPGSARATGTNPKVTADYHVTDNDMVYATASRGFRPGGSNIPLPSTCDTSLEAAGIVGPAPSKYDPDSVWNYEIGAKTSWADRRVTADVAAYQMDWSNIQLPVPLPSCKIQGYETNAGDARSRGGEIEVAAVPVENFTVALAAAYIDAELTSNSVVLSAKAGTPLLYVPRWSWNASGQYGFHLGGLKSYFRADVKYHDKTPLDYVGELWSDSYTELDMRWALDGQTSVAPWEVALYVVNVTDTLPLLSKDALGYGMGYSSVTIRPRTVGLSLSMDF
jgi:iron complex outermembrane recepter protein